jgi:tripartite-type tricarboxylate transporter receptor subunit TctC
MGRGILFALATLGIVSLHAGAAAAQWPSKPVRIVVPYAAGGAADTIGRIFAERLGEAFGQQFYVENRSGGGGLIGTEAVARAQPDGYTLMVSGIPSHVLGPAMSPQQASFDPVRDFTHIAYFGGPPNMFVAQPSLGVRSFDALVARLRAEPNGLEYVSPSIGSVGNMVAEVFAAKEKLKLTHITYRGGGQAILDLVAGHVKVGSMTLTTTREHIRTGTLVPLAISSAERSPELPDVPTLKELGHPDLVITTWFSLSGPAGLPADVVGKINAAVNRSLDDPKVQRHLDQEAVQSRAMSPAQTTEFVRSEVAKWVPVVRSIVTAAGK